MVKNGNIKYYGKELFCMIEYYNGSVYNHMRDVYWTDKALQ